MMVGGIAGVDTNVVQRINQDRDLRQPGCSW